MKQQRPMSLKVEDFLSVIQKSKNPQTLFFEQWEKDRQFALQAFQSMRPGDQMSMAASVRVWLKQSLWFFEVAKKQRVEECARILWCQHQRLNAEEHTRLARFKEENDFNQCVKKQSIPQHMAQESAQQTNPSESLKFNSQKQMPLQHVSEEVKFENSWSHSWSEEEESMLFEEKSFSTEQENSNSHGTKIINLKKFKNE